VIIQEHQEMPEVTLNLE